MTGTFPHTAPACPPTYGILSPTSVPHAHPDGFLLLTATRGDDDCELVQTLWDKDANILDGPHSFSTLFSSGNPAMDPHGIAGTDGTVITGTIKGEGFDETDTDGTIIIDLDKWSQGGQHERLAHFEESWEYSPEETASYEVLVSLVGQSVYYSDEMVSIFALQGTFNDDYSNVFSNAIFATVNPDGMLVSGPELLENDIPQPPAGLENTSWGWSFRTFSSNGDEIMELTRVLYIDLNGFIDYESSIDDPFVNGLWTRMIGFDGAPSSQWTQVA